MSWFSLARYIPAVAIVMLLPMVANAQSSCLPVGGNLTLNGILEVEIGGPTQCDDYDSVLVSGTTLFGATGVVDVTILNAYSPTGTFEILTSVGAITDNGLTLDPSDTGQFSLTVNSNSVILTSLTGGQPGDFDGDGDVDGDDFLEWQRTDATAPGLTDWQNNYPTVLAALSAQAVPEPSSILLLLGMTALVAGRRIY